MRGCVVKLGGSLMDAPELPNWLDALARLGGGRVAVVPGGGRFADAVREAQRQRPFPDAAAHRMALLAMEQYAWMLAGLEPRLTPLSGCRRLLRALQAGQVPVWLPAVDLIGRPRIQESWDLTSDSLAAWLAGRLAVDRVLLVKSVEESISGTPADWAAAGWVDPLFPAWLQHAGAQAQLVGRTAWSDLAGLLAG